MKGKEEMLATLRIDGQSLLELTKALKIQYYQGKLLMEELIREGKAESYTIGKRTKYKRTNSSLNAPATPPGASVARDNQQNVPMTGQKKEVK